jgi:hypothetical protein
MSKAVIMASWDDVPHLPDDVKKAMLASIPPWQRDSRSKGIPQLGSGSIFTVPEEDFAENPLEIPKHWPRCFSLDVGWNRTAALWAALDRDTGCVHIYDELYRAKTEPSVIAEAMRGRGKWIPGVIDPASRGRSQKDGTALMDVYRDLGLDIEKADNTVEAGIYKVWEMLGAGLIKVSRACPNFFAEYRLYRRDAVGKVVKSNDHLMDALRYLIMTGLGRAILQPNERSATWWKTNVPQMWTG